MRDLSWKGALARRLLWQLLLLSGVLTLLGTATVLYDDYRHEFGVRDEAVARIHEAYLPALGQSLWKYDDQQIQTQLKGILNFPYVNYVSVQDAGAATFQAGKPATVPVTDEYQFPLVYQYGDNRFSIGTLYLQTDTSMIYQEVLRKSLLILATQFLKALIISAAVLYLVRRLITRHLHRLALWADQSNLEEPLMLNREPQDDELERVMISLRYMQNQLKRTVQQRDDALQELENLNNGLERKIECRTLEFRQAVTDLNELVEELKFTQKQLVESEKMAQLGNLVAGVAHELSTPLGICVTARSYIEDSLALIRQRMKEGSLDRKTFSELINSITDGLMMIDENLNRSHRLVRTFKSLAVDRTTDHPSQFELLPLLEEASGGAGSFDIDGAECHIEVSAPKAMAVMSCRNTLHTVLGALIGNTLDHGYPNGGDIHINIEAAADRAGNRLLIDYRDDGCGLAPEVKEHIFEPFFTTGRKRGKTGLGMHLVYNLVRQVLMGKIEVQDTPQGIHLRIDIPLDLERYEKENQRPLRLVASNG